MPNILQLAPSVGSVSPTLDLNAAGIGLFQLMANPEPKFDPPPLRRATAGTLLSDGLRQPAAAFDNRTITFTLRLLSGTQAQKQTALGALYQELNKLAPVLRLQYSDASTSTWYRLLRSPANPIRRIRADGRALLVDVELLAEPFGYGLPVILPIVTVNDDPAAAGNAMCLDVDSTAAVANANPYFETDVSSWSGINGAALSRTTAQFHQGIAAMRLTPDGITAAPRAQSEQIAVAAGASVYAQAWLRSPGATPTVGMTIRWYSDAAGTVFLSKSGSPSLVLVSSTWTFSAVSDAAPATAVSYRLAPEYSGTPTAGTLLDVDEALGGPSDGAVGDVETPLSFSLPAGDLFSTDEPKSVIAVRRRGVPTLTPFLLQAEACTPATADTTLPGADAAMSGSGSNYTRTTFTSTAGHTARLWLNPWPAVIGKDNRGTYRVFACVRKSVTSDVITVSFGYQGGAPPVGGVQSIVYNDTVTLPNGSGVTRQIVDLGLVQVPAGPDPVTSGYSGVEIPVKGRYIELRAGRTSGTGNLDIDYLLFVPADDNLSIVDWGDALSGSDEFVVDTPQQMIYSRLTTGEIYSAGSAQVAGSVGVMVSPGGPNRVYFVRRVGSGAANTKTSTTPLTAWYWPRYLSWAP